MGRLARVSLVPLDVSTTTDPQRGHDRRFIRDCEADRATYLSVVLLENIDFCGVSVMVVTALMSNPCPCVDRGSSASADGLARR